MPGIESHRVKQVVPPEWMRAPQTMRVMDALGAGNARFVGGCVRNMLLGCEVGDVDIATVWTPEEVTARLESAWIKVVPTGIDHGTVTAVIDKAPFEITTLRKDIETDGRRAVVGFTKDWREDALRRDFTMNTLLADMDGNIYDPTGEGVKDLEARRVRFVGDPAKRIAEDYLRVLRFFRFHAAYGKGEPDKDALAACREAAGKISTLSRERITQEVFKILSVENPVEILSVIFDNRILPGFVFPEYEPGLMRHVCTFQNRFGLAFIASRIFILSGLSLKNVEAMEKILLLPKVFRKDIEAISQVLNLPPLNKDHAVRAAVYEYGRVPAAQALMIELAQDRVMNGYALKAIEIIQKWDIPDFPLTGNDLMKAGIKEGPELGAALRIAEDWWIENEFRPDRTALFNYLISKPPK